MADSRQTPEANARATVAGGQLSPALLRDLADLNREFIELSLEPALTNDPRFGLAPAVREGLAGCPAAIRQLLAACPFSLFQLSLPEAEPSCGRWPEGVADALEPAAPDPLAAGRRHEFILLGLYLARQLAAHVPLHSRLALGLAPAMEQRLCRMGPTDLANLARWPGLVRPRWPRHERFWHLLMMAARGRDGASLQQAHCVGFCLLGSPAGLEPAAVPAASRRRSGPGRGIPC